MPLYNLAREYSYTTGTGATPIVVSGAVPGCNTFEDAGVANGAVFRYGLITYNTTSGAAVDSETGLTSYNASTNTLARGTVDASTNAGSWVDLTGLAQVYICPNTKDLPLFAAYYGSTDTITNATDNHVMTIDTEWVDELEIASLATNTITVNYPSWISVSMSLSFSGASAFNGYIHLEQPQYGLSIRKAYETAHGIQSDTLFLGPLLFNVSTTQAFTFEVDNHLGESIDAIINDVTLRGSLK